MSSPEPGPLAEELARLLGAAQDWLSRTGADPTTARIATGSAECCWCPICQLIATVRGERPELMQRLADLQDAALGLWHAAAAGAPAPAAASAAEAGVPDPGPAGSAAARVHRIRLDDEPPADC